MKKQLNFKIILFLMLLTSCEGYYKATGTVYENKDGYKKPMVSTTVKVYCGPDLLRGATMTDSTGKYNVTGLTTPNKATYYIIFEKSGFKTDTIKIKGNRGKTFISLDQIMTKK